MKKALSIALILVLVVALFAGCGAKTDEPAAPADPTPAAPADEPLAGSTATTEVEFGGDSSLDVEETYEWPEMTIVVNDYNVPQSGPAVSTQKACDYIEEVSGGKIKCDVHYGGTLMESTDSYAGTIDGIADITYYLYSLNSGAAPLHNLFGNYFCREMPDMEGMVEVLANVLENVPEFRQEFEQQGLYELVCFVTGGSRYEFKDEELGMSIKTPEDLKGLVIQASGYCLEVMANNGVSGMNMPPSEWYTNLNTGIVDALAMNMPGVRDFGLNDVTNCYINFGNNGGVSHAPNGYLCNLDSWNSWDPEVQALVQEAFILAAKYNAEMDNIRQNEVLQAERDAGKAVNDIAEEDMGPWYELGNQANDLWKEACKDLCDVDAVLAGYLAEIDQYWEDNPKA